jgi:hypothetical protein
VGERRASRSLLAGSLRPLVGKGVCLDPRGSEGSFRVVLCGGDLLEGVELVVKEPRDVRRREPPFVKPHPRAPGPAFESRPSPFRG